MKKRNRKQADYFHVVDTQAIRPTQRLLPEIEQRLDDWDWGDKPRGNPHRNILISPILFGQEDKLDYIRDIKEAGIVKKVMFDSGGYQILTGRRFKEPMTMDMLIDRNTELYNRLDFADKLMAVDHPASLDDHEDEFRRKVDLTITSTLKLFDQLNDNAKERYVPIFHVRSDLDIGRQISAYKGILAKSNKAAFSAAGLTYSTGIRRVSTVELSLVDHLNKALPHCGIHYLGSGSPLAAFMLSYIGLESYDSASPLIEAGKGRVIFPYISFTACSTKYTGDKINLTEENLRSYQKESNHSCPFCADWEKLRDSYAGSKRFGGRVMRTFHNLTVMDELQWHYNNLDLEVLKRYSLNTYKTLMDVTDDKQLTLF